MMKIDFNGFIVEGDFPAEDLRRAAINECIRQRLGTFTDGGVYTPPSLEAVKAWATTEVNRQAEAQRLQYITPGDGQAMTYLAKQLIELTAYDAANGDPDPAAVPMMVNRAALRGVTIADVASEWRAVMAAWHSVAAGIEAVRESANAAIAQAGTVEAIADILAGLE